MLNLYTSVNNARICGYNVVMENEFNQYIKYIYDRTVHNDLKKLLSISGYVKRYCDVHEWDIERLKGLILAIELSDTRLAFEIKSINREYIEDICMSSVNNDMHILYRDFACFNYDIPIKIDGELVESSNIDRVLYNKNIRHPLLDFEEDGSIVGTADERLRVFNVLKEPKNIASMIVMCGLRIPPLAGVIRQLEEKIDCSNSKNQNIIRGYIRYIMNKFGYVGYDCTSKEVNIENIVEGVNFKYGELFNNTGNKTLKLDYFVNRED